jgi:hypothetical protein
MPQALHINSAIPTDWNIRFNPRDDFPNALSRNTVQPPGSETFFFRARQA